jgi:hypothetical protein
MQAPCEIGEAPTTPWISFKVLFGLVQDNISSIARELLFHHYEEFEVLMLSKLCVSLVLIMIGMLGTETFKFFLFDRKVK